MNKSETIAELGKALVKAQPLFSPVKRSVKVDFLTKAGARVKYSYAPLADVLDACRKALVDNGIAISQPTKMVDDKLFVETMLIHSSGEWLSGEISIAPSDHNPQSEGSALTYARRYGLSAMLGIASEEDDDAEGAMVRGQKVKEQVKPAPNPKPNPTPKPEADEEDANYKAFWAHCGSELGLNSREVHTMLGVESVKDELVAKGITLRQVYNMVVEKMKASGNPSLEL